MKRLYHIYQDLLRVKEIKNYISVVWSIGRNVCFVNGKDNLCFNTGKLSKAQTFKTIIRLLIQKSDLILLITT